MGATPAQTLVGVLREALAPRVIDYLSIDAENNGALLLLVQCSILISSFCHSDWFARICMLFVYILELWIYKAICTG